MSSKKILDNLLNLTSTIIGLTSLMYGNEFALTITDTEKCLFSKWTDKIDFNFRVGDKVLEKYGAYQCMKSGKSIKLEITNESIEDSYIVFSQPIKNNDEIVGSLNVITSISDEELLYNIRTTFSISQNEELNRSEEKDNDRYKLLGQCTSIVKIREKIEKVKDIDSNVLITGESGTGKGVIAKILHYTSERKNEPFIHINCASIPSNLIESELFGHEKGAFTGATSTKKGKFEIAGKGTIFLDEINSLDIVLQAKLLGVIQEKKITRIGDYKEIPIYARIIAASNENFQELIEQKRFREDLFYRLSVILINCPPLRDRGDDIELLMKIFINKISRKFNKRITSVSKECLKILNKYSWPGNVRELENTLECAIALTDSTEITVDDLPPRIFNNIKEKQQSRNNKKHDYDNLILNNEIEIIKKVLIKNNGHRQKSADDLGITRRALQYKLKKFNLINFNKD